MQKNRSPEEIAEDLGTLDPLWRGWKIRRGMIYDPQSTTTLGWTPSQVRALTYWRQELSALHVEMQRLRSETHDLELLIGEHGPKEAGDKVRRRRKREARQLEILSRHAQSPTAHRSERPVRSPRSNSSFSVPWRPGMPDALVRARPPATQRDRK